MNIALPASRLVEFLEREAATSSSLLPTYWYTVASSRSEYASHIENCSSNIAIVPLVPRRAGLFQAPNALLSDLVELIEEHKDKFHLVRDQLLSDKKVALVILGRHPLNIPGGSSPTPLPHWFPRYGGTVVNLELRDLTYRADAPLNCVEGQLPSLCAGLFHLENALLRRTQQRLSTDSRACEPLFTLISSPGEQPQALLQRFIETAGNVQNPEAFRPSVRDGRSFVSRLVAVFYRSTPDQLSSRGEAIGKALQIGATDAQPMVSVLLRPTQRDLSPFAVWGRSLLTTVYATYQYCTAAAHADAYDRYPVGLIHSTSLDLLRRLDALAFHCDSGA